MPGAHSAVWFEGGGGGGGSGGGSRLLLSCVHILFTVTAPLSYRSVGRERRGSRHGNT